MPQVGVMGAQQAVGIVSRREIAAAEDPERARRRLATDYAAEHLDVSSASAGGFIDETVVPAQTRERLASVLAALDGAPRNRRPGRNIPL